MTEGRKTFLKYFGLATAAQIGLCLVIVLLINLFSPTLDLLFLVLLYGYAPTMYLVLWVGDLHGAAAMGYPIILGIPLGIVFYSYLVAAVIRRRRKVKRNG